MKFQLFILLTITQATSVLAWAPHTSVAGLQRRSRALHLKAQSTNGEAVVVEAPAVNGDSTTTTTTANGQTTATTTRYGAVKRSHLNSLYDVICIGGGPAGVGGAVKAAQMGRQALVIDRPKAPPLDNGLDLFFGAPTGLCSKALRDAAKTISVKALRAQGLDEEVIWNQVQCTIVKLATRNAQGVNDLLSKLKVDYLQGEATLLAEDNERAMEASQALCSEDCEEESVGARSVVVSGATVVESDGTLATNDSVLCSATHILLATGSKAMQLRGIPFDGQRVFESDTINSLSFLPKSVVISGAGIIAIEFANIFRSLDADVTMLIRGDLATSAEKLGMDPDVTDELMRLLVQSGVKIIEGVTVDEFLSVPPAAAESTSDKAQMQLSNGQVLESDIFLAALGRTGNGAEEVLGLDDNDIPVSRGGHVELDRATLQTTSRNVAAAGDVVGYPGLASTGKTQADNAIEVMFGSTDKQEDDNFGSDISIGVWTIPEIGYFGLTKAQAEAKGMRVVEGIARFDECLRGRVFAPDGLLKIVANADTGVVVGVHMIGMDAAEMVHYGMSLVKTQATIGEIMSTTYTAVTFHELFKEAALAANFAMDFGVEWQLIFEALLDTCELDPVTGAPKDTVSLEELRETFDRLDSDGSGGLDEEELRELFASQGRKVSKRVIANLMRLSDTDGNGVIDWEEFQAIWDKIHC